MLLAGAQDRPYMASVVAAADSPLVRAAAAGDGAAVRRLLKQGVDVNAAGADGTTALHWMVRADDLEAADLLLRAGARPSTPNALGLTPVYIAAENGNAALLRRLLDAGTTARFTGVRPRLHATPAAVSGTASSAAPVSGCSRRRMARRRSAISRSRSRHSIGRDWPPGYASCAPRCCRRRTNRTSCGSGTTTGSLWKCAWRNENNAHLPAGNGAAAAPSPNHTSGEPLVLRS